MAEKVLKGLKFPGLEDDYILPFDNTTPVGLVTKNIYVNSTSASLETQIADIYANMANNTSELVSMQKADGVTVSIGNGSNWQLLICKTNDNYGAIIAVQYPSNTSTYVVIKTRGLSGGTWGNWNTITTNDTILTSANWSDYISVSSGGTTATGMGREFDQSPNASSFTTSSTKSKFYIITLGLDGDYSYSLTVDYRSVRASSDARTYRIPGTSSSLITRINSDNTVTFESSSATIQHICGYY